MAGVKIYYSYDPNFAPVSGIWPRPRKRTTRKTEIPAYPKLPLYAGHCRYQLDQEMTLQVGSSKTFSINSKEAIHEPHDVDLKELSKLAESGLIEDFSNGTADWSSRNGDSITTYKLLVGSLTSIAPTIRSWPSPSIPPVVITPFACVWQFLSQ